MLKVKVVQVIFFYVFFYIIICHIIGQKRAPTSRSNSPASKRRQPSPVLDWGQPCPTHIPRLEWRGYADHRTKFLLCFAATKCKKLNPDRSSTLTLKTIPVEVWMKIWDSYKDLDESAEVCRDWPGYCHRKWGPRSHERSLNMSDAEQCKRMNWVHQVLSTIFFLKHSQQFRNHWRRETASGLTNYQRWLITRG